MLGEPEIAPFAAERQGGGAGGKAGPAGRGVERATFTGPGGFTPAGSGALAPGVQGSGIPTWGGGRTRVFSRQARKTQILLPAQALARRSCVWVCISQQRGIQTEGGKEKGTREGAGRGEGSGEVK